MNLIGKVDRRLLGSEFDWLATDQLGNIGYFSTAGEGWVPESVLADYEAFWNSLDAVALLPVVGEPEPCFSCAHNVHDWLVVAARGLYAFDWNRGTKRYELVARPTAKPMIIEGSDVLKLAGVAILPCSFQSDFTRRVGTEVGAVYKE